MEDPLESEYAELTPQCLEQLAKQRENRKRKQNTAAKTKNEQFTGSADNQAEELQPDPTLRDGEKLPQYYGKCPDHLMGQPIEDLDPYYRENGIPTFCVATKRFSSVYIYRFTAERACFLLSPFNPVRRFAIRASVNQFFDYFVMITIIVNCVFLALDNEIVESEYVFTAIYTLEMIIKLVARGVIFHQFTYLRDGWNWLDFVVVILAWITIIITAATQGPSHLNLSGLRTFRVLRAFKSFTIVPGLKTIVNALLQSLKPLAEVMVIMLFLVVVISLIALQAYKGVLRRKCVSYLPTFNTLSAEQFNAYVLNSSNWNPVDGELVVCGNASSSGLCPDGYVCMQDVGDNPNHGYTNFDNFGWAMLTSFQLLTLDFWENVYNMIIRAEGAWNVLFFFMCVVLGPFYLLNLLLAVVTLAYSKEHEKQTKLREMRERAKVNARRRNKRRRLLMDHSRKKEMTTSQTGDIVHLTNENNTNGPILANGDASSRSMILSPEISDGKLDVPSVQISRSNSAEIKNSDTNSQQSLHESRSKLRAMKKDMSLESSESAGSSISEWKAWAKTKYSSFKYLFCSWSCPSKFKNFQQALTKVVEHKAFEGFVVLSIVTNTVFLAMDHHNIDPTFESVLNIGNYVFTGIFALEALLKILAKGVIGYFKEGWNVFDFIIVVISLLEFAIPSSTGALSVLRSLRLMRVFRLARIWTTMRKLMSIILKSLSAVVYLTIVLFMVLFIFAVVGKQLFGSQYAASGSKFDDGLVPRWNFVDFYHSFLLVWRVMCGEWIEPLHDCMYIAEPASCIPVFLLMTFIGNFLVLNLFTAILLEAFNVDSLKAKKKQEQKDAKIKRMALFGLKKFVKKKSQNKSSKLEESQSSSKESNDQQETKITESDETAKTSATENSEQVPDKKRSMSMANIFALNQVSGKKRGVNQSASLREIQSGQKHNDKEENTNSNSVGALPERRKTLTKQSRISLDDIPFSDNDGDEILDSDNDQQDESLSPPGESTKKVTFAVTSNSKVHPKGRSSPDNNSSTRTGRTTKVSFCRKCCFFCPNSGGNNVTSVVSDEPQSTSGDVEEEKGESEVKKPPRCFPKWCNCNCAKGWSAFKIWMKCRQIVFEIVEHQFFEWFILIVILASTVSLAFEDVNLKNDPERERILNILEYVFTTIFTIEMILKWIGIGWSKYFTDWWCIIDFLIVVISWIGIGASAVGEVESLKALRTLRALRPLRAISRWQGMRVVVNALVYCIPSIGNVLCVCLLLWLVFSIIGVQLFKGRFYRCEDSEGEIVNSTLVPNRFICQQHQNYTWTTPRINFDNVINGMIALFQVATFEGWIEVMSDASDAVGIDQQPIREANMYSYIYFFIFVLFGSFFILNLIVGVIIESFQKLRKQTESASAIEAFLTESQKNFYKTMRTMLNRKPKKTIPPPENVLQLKVFKLVTHRKFELVVFSVIVLNMITLAMEHYQMSDTWATVLKYVDISFTTIFVLEALLKIIGTRFYYFRDAFNVFDFVVVMLSVIGFILEELLTFLVSPTLLRVVRVFRVFRVLRVIRAARGIRRLILTLMISLPALFNIAVLLGVFMVIFAILGMSFFMEVKLRGALNDIVNFRTFVNSMMLLFRLMTSAGWNDVLDPLMNDTDCNGTDCGKYHIAIIYFVIYIFLVFLVVVNMYIAIILENFDEIFQQEESGVGQDDFEFFYVVWGRYDPKASQFVSIAELSNLLHSLHPPFQLAKPNEIKIAALNLPIVNGDKVHCLDVLFALVKRIMGEVEISDQMRQEAEARLLKSFPNRKSLKAETTTLVLRQRVKAAKVIQEAWRGFNGKRRRAVDSSINDISTISPSRSMIEKRVYFDDEGTQLPQHTPSCEVIVENVVIPEVAENQLSAPEKQEVKVIEVNEKEEHKRKDGKSANHKEKNISDEKFLNKPSPVKSKSEIADSGIDKQTSFESISSSEENSALIIKNKHVTNGKTDTLTKPSLPSKLGNDEGVKTVAQPSIKNKSEIQQPQVKSSDKKSPHTNNEGQQDNATLSKSEVKRTLSTPVTGKELKFNPHTGQFKKRTIKQNDATTTAENTNASNSGTVDHSVVIVNKHSTG